MRCSVHFMGSAAAHGSRIGQEDLEHSLLLSQVETSAFVGHLILGGPCFTQWLLSLMVFRKGPSCELLVTVIFNLIFPYRTSLIIFLGIKHIKTRGLHLDEWRPCINIFFQVGWAHPCCPLLAARGIGHTLDLFFIHFIWKSDSSESEKENVSHIHLIMSLANRVPM